jgi:hypothetical protein
VCRESLSISLERIVQSKFASNLDENGILQNLCQHFFTLAVFSWPNLAVPNSLFGTIVYCNISFVFGNNCPTID